MDTQTLILLSVGLIIVATMIYCIMKTEDETPSSKSNNSEQYNDEPEELFDDDETSAYTIDDDADESIFDSE